MIGFATQNHRKRSSKPMFLKNKDYFFAFQPLSRCLSTPTFSLEWDFSWTKFFLKNFDKLILRKSVKDFSLGIFWQAYKRTYPLNPWILRKFIPRAYIRVNPRHPWRYILQRITRIYTYFKTTNLTLTLQSVATIVA